MTIISYLSRVLIGLASLLSLAAQAHYMIPGESQKNPVLIKNATVNTVSNGVLKNTDILIKDGLIANIGKIEVVTANTITIEAKGKHVYPGIIALHNWLGLQEVEAVRASVDFWEVGDINPNIYGHIAFDYDSRVVPTVRSMGITHTQVTPLGNLIMGQSSLMKLDAWNMNDGIAKAGTGLHIDWPDIGYRLDIWQDKDRAAQQEAREKAIDTLLTAFDDAKAWLVSDQSTLDQRWTAMSNALKGEQKVYIHATDAREIAEVLAFVQEYQLKAVLVGATDAHLMLDQIKAQNIEVIYDGAFGVPSNDDDAYDHMFTLPGQFAAAGIPFAISISQSWDIRNLPFAAGNTVAHGLDRQKALEAITLTPAKILGVDDMLGSIEIGKQASLIISKGDILDFTGHPVETMMIEGRMVDLNNHHKKLYKKYQQK